MTQSTRLATPSMPCRLSRRLLLVAGAAATFAPRLALAQEYPSKPIRLMVGATPGGSIDFGARAIAIALGEALGQTVIVENKPGAAGVINSDYVAKSAPDGYTLMVGTPSPVIIAPQAMAKATFNALTDVIPINMVSTSPIGIAVNPRLQVKRLSDLVALAKQRTVTMGLPLAGSVSHLTTELIAKAAGITFQNVPYKGAAPAITDTIAGHIDATVSDVGVFLPFHREERLRIVSVTSEKRVEALPDVFAATEEYPGLVVTNWVGLFAPAKTPKAVIDKINAALQKTVANKDVRAQFGKSSVTATSMASQQAFQTFVAAEYHRYGALLRERNIVIE
ncbi:MAG TPA: tripartite tricarboxylate transporter substrate binding protein [Ramlibacter sp.]|nr:tripartite tricarboxylate transporter substrate binding protein [Ramlibacter sp.]